LRIASVGTLKNACAVLRSKKPSYDPKKNSEFLRIGPPIVPPKMLRSRGGLIVLK
jgi:hypothetical protein